MQLAFQEFPAHAYLDKYYSYVGEENNAWLRAILEAAHTLDRAPERVAEVGGGPVIAPLLALCTVWRDAPRRVGFFDGAPQNLAEVRHWVDAAPQGFGYEAISNWLGQQTSSDITRVIELLRAATWEIEVWDVDQPGPEDWVGMCDVVSSHFFAESATDVPSKMVDYLRRTAALCRPGGLLVLSFMRRSAGYSVAGHDFPATSIDEHDLGGYLAQAGVELDDFAWSTVGVEDPPTRPGYDGMLFCRGRIRIGVAVR